AENMPTQQGCGEMPIFSFHALKFMGVCVVNFIVHSCILSVMRCHSNPPKRVRDTWIAYCISLVLSVMVGTMGHFGYKCIAIPQDFSELFPQNGATCFVSALLLLDLFCVFPVLILIARENMVGIYWVHSDQRRDSQAKRLATRLRDTSGTPRVSKRTRDTFLGEDSLDSELVEADTSLTVQQTPTRSGQERWAPGEPGPDMLYTPGGFRSNATTPVGSNKDLPALDVERALTDIAETPQRKRVPAGLL
ncbi:hypothetical protein KIPB_009790, partial [Kipferlia bialata]